ncbi:hypothetical protein [Corynebacterium sp. ES2715-CONJ3]|uniref:Rv3212 family protein n=1 Tax=Corynebacterium sp. ES2715-CONJ3 TaxID=2974028 RepID=UPI002167179F|nr:hypothetical protein [Corynebacterium sp. ES2715-CONJ3]MCS4491521.1 hypothetical protein [Corynebacterium sp. ES2715-CONJ3]
MNPLNKRQWRERALVRSPEGYPLQARRLISSPLHYISAAIIAIAALSLVISAVISAPIRSVSLHPAKSSFAAPEKSQTLANQYVEVRSIPDDSLAPAPLLVQGLLVTTTTIDQTSIISASDPDTGEEIWSYSRDLPLCAVTEAWDDIVAIYRNGAGCGDVVSLKAATGTYSSTRSSSAPMDVSALVSNDRVGYISPARIDLWRSDLVRTIEYGLDPTPHEPELQPHPGCTIISAQTRVKKLALIEQCEDRIWLRILSTEPEESRSPQVDAEYELTGTNPAVVGITEETAAVYIEQPEPHYLRFTLEAKLVADSVIDPIQQTGPGPTTAVISNDLQHHIAWFDGRRLYILHPLTLDIDYVVDDASGLPADLGSYILYPTAEGFAAVESADGNPVRKIQIAGGVGSSPGALGVAGRSIVLKSRGKVRIYQPA